MAEFSKQWIEKNKLNITPDFNILEIVEQLNEQEFTSIICEGFGFIAVGKKDGEIVLGFPDGPSTDSGTPIKWQKYREVIK
jgi:hypothetical protein